jgi:hypothetical protein
MGRLFAFILVLVAVAAGVQASPAAMTVKPVVNLPAIPSGPANYATTAPAKLEIHGPFGPVGPSFDHGLATTCAFCTGHDGGEGPR